MPFWQFYQKSADWLDWPALLVQLSISAHRKWPEMVVSASTNQVWTKITIRSYAHVFCHSEPDRSSVWAMHWICALKSWFLLHFSFIFFYVSSWNDIIKSQGKNLRSGDRRNYFHHISSDTSTCSNYFAFTLRNRYVVKNRSQGWF